MDLAEYRLPILDEAVPPMAGRYQHPHTLNWAAAVGSFDGYVFVTPEIADIRSPVTLIFGEDFQGYAELTPRAVQEQRVTTMLDELTAWASALKTLRQP